MKECPFCHAKIEENARFCIHCMTSFEEKEVIPVLRKTSKGFLFVLVALSAVSVVTATGLFSLADKIPDNTSPPPQNLISGTEGSTLPSENFSRRNEKDVFDGILPNLTDGTPATSDIQGNTNSKQTARPSAENSQNTATPPDTPEPKEEISYTFDEDTGTLTLTGTGAMEDYNYSNFLADASPWHMYRKSIKKVVLSEGITTIGSYAFFDCSALTEISIPQSVTTICVSAFRSCTGLTECTIPDSIITIEGAAFADCTGLTEISLPKSVTSIASFAFEGCYNVTKVTVSAENSTYYAVNNCIIEGATKTLVSGFKNSIIPDDGSVTKIGDHAFYDMATRTEITLPNGITSIGKMSFNRCTELTEITLPESLTTIETNAFCGCTELKTVYNKSSLPIVKGSTNYGYVAYYAENVYN